MGAGRHRGNRRQLPHRPALTDRAIGAGGIDVRVVREDDAMLDTLGMTGAGAPPSRQFSHDLQFQKIHVEMLLGLRHGGDMPQEAEEVLLDTLACLLQSHVPIRAQALHAGVAR